MKKRAYLWLAIALFGATAYAQTPKLKYMYKLTHLSVTEAVITCQNGGDPTFKHLTPTAVMVSCGGIAEVASK